MALWGVWAPEADPWPSGGCAWPWDAWAILIDAPPPRQVQPLVLLRHHQHFAEWHSRWLEDNVTVEAASLVQDWLMGEDDEDMVPCKTLCETVRVHGLPVNRYRVQYSRRPASP